MLITDLSDKSNLRKISIGLFEYAIWASLGFDFLGHNKNYMFHFFISEGG
jgi:hypothetical protein